MLYPKAEPTPVALERCNLLVNFETKEHFGRRLLAALGMYFLKAPSSTARNRFNLSDFKHPGISRKYPSRALQAQYNENFGYKQGSEAT